MGFGVQALRVGSGNEKRLEDVLQQGFIRQHILNGNLSMMKLRRSHHLHGTRNLASAVHTGYASLYFFQRCHNVLCFKLSCDPCHYFLNGLRSIVVDLAGCQRVNDILMLGAHLLEELILA